MVHPGGREGGRGEAGQQARARVAAIKAFRAIARPPSDRSRRPRDARGGARAGKRARGEARVARGREMGGGGRRGRGFGGGDGGESPAVAAVVGGILAQEVLRSVTGKGEPVRNSFFFGVRNGQGTVENMGCPT